MSVTDRPAITMPRDIVSEQQCNITFVKTVQKYPCLYNFELPSYTRKDLSDKAWEEVAEAMNMTPSACRERWRNLRAVFMRTVKQTGLGTKKKPYYLADVMQFVIPFLRPTNMTEAEKQKMQNIEYNRLETSRLKEINPPPLEIELDDIKTESVDEDTGPEWSVETTNTSQKRSLESDEYYPSPKRPPPPIPGPSIAIPESSDPVSSFVNSLMPELRELNSAQFKCFKRRVLVLIDDITTEIPSTSRNDKEYSTYE